MGVVGCVMEPAIVIAVVMQAASARVGSGRVRRGQMWCKRVKSPRSVTMSWDEVEQWWL